MRRLLAAGIAVACLFTISGCQWRGLNSLALPGTKGGGEGSYTIQAELPDVVTIQQNSRVRVADLNVGNVTKIEARDWHALVTMRIDGSVRLPANSTAKVGQTSLLGSMHIELAPPTDEPPRGELTDGTLIPLSRAGSYPTTEQTLASVSVLLNGGGLGQLQEITRSFATALAGRENDMRSLLNQLDTFITALNDQTGDIITAIEKLNALAGQVAARNATVDTALNTIPQALAVLADSRVKLAEAIDALGKFSAIAASTVNQTKESLVNNLRNLAPPLRALADAGPALTRGLDFLSTYPWVKSTIPNWFRGDFANITLVIDLTLSRIDSGLFTGTRWEGNLTELEMQWGRTIGQMPSPYTAGNPLIAPYNFGGTDMLRLPRSVWIQLAILASITVIAGSVMIFGFAKVPELLGIGRYTVTVTLPTSGGLYPTSVVNYRGTEVGRVKSVDVTRDGVRAVLRLNSDVPVPADVQAAVHSRSGVGEQFLELTPPATVSTTRNLGNGDTIAVGKADIPPDIAGLLDAANRALTAIPPDNLRTVVDESAKAIGGLGPELARIVDGSTALGIEAGKATDSLTTLIDQSPPVLNSQVQTADSIAAWAAHMASITTQFKEQDKALASLLAAGGPALEEGKALFDRFAPAMPVLLANLVSLGDIAVTYNNNLEQLLVLFPQGTAVMSAITVANAGTKQDYRGIYLDFNLNLNLPPPCNTGFLPAAQQRSPAQVDHPERPVGDVYCRIPQDSDMNVRGVRNIPCANNPAKRAPTVEMCESDQNYVPLNDGFNWKGDPNATLSEQGIPQYPPVAAVPYDPATGDYIGPDGRRYTQSDLPHSGGETWQSMLVPPTP